jgi:hypothetical protein
LTIGRAKHGEIGNWIDKQAFSPHCKLFCVERRSARGVRAPIRPFSTAGKEDTVC